MLYVENVENVENPKIPTNLSYYFFLEYFKFERKLKRVVEV
jgi:hypothetical protein